MLSKDAAASSCITGIPSLREYLILAQDKMFAELRRRMEDGTWVMRWFSNAADVIRLESVDCSLELSSQQQSKPDQTRALRSCLRWRSERPGRYTRSKWRLRNFHA